MEQILKSVNCSIAYDFGSSVVRLYRVTAGALMEDGRVENTHEHNILIGIWVVRFEVEGFMAELGTALNPSQWVVISCSFRARSY